ncbi:MAG TPA: hypothetical protein VJS65_02505 [Verrucomicrobiae bacterium]|nr:hypothetical protein [Verrucomicrobiae bacterium]
MSIENGLRRTWVRQFALVVWLGAGLFDKAAAQGIPEPSLVMYGVVENSQDPDRLRVVVGTLTWLFQPVGGGPSFAVSTTMTNINDQFSYILRVPCETDVPGFPVSSNALRLGTAYTRSSVFLNGTNQATLVDPAQASFSLSATSRGRIERLDLNVSVAIEDLDGNGLSDAWERLYFGGTGVDPSADPDGDGMDNLTESKAGTNPNDFQSQFKFIRITPQGGGVLVEWSSVTNRSYSILRSTDLLTGFQVLSGNRPATPPTNSFLDATAAPTGKFFYVIRLQE